MSRSLDPYCFPGNDDLSQALFKQIAVFYGISEFLEKGSFKPA